MQKENFRACFQAISGILTSPSAIHFLRSGNSNSRCGGHRLPAQNPNCLSVTLRCLQRHPVLNDASASLVGKVDDRLPVATVHGNWWKLSMGTGI